MNKKLDISTQYTKEENKNNGRKGYLFWKREKDTVIPVNKFGEFLQRKGKK